LQARGWAYSYNLRYRAINLISRRTRIWCVIPLATLLALSLIAAPRLRLLVGTFFAKSERLAALRTLFVTLGAAFVGATAIGFSIVIFAMQTNFARLPYIVFRRFSADLRLLSAFATTFILALGVATGSLIPDERRVAIIVIYVSWATIAILILVLYSYRRALALISPYQQISFIVQRALADMNAWGRRANHAEHLVVNQSADRSGADAAPDDPKHDVARAVFFRDIPNWTALTGQAITHLVSFSRRLCRR
jgi:uncharacterized membrane protein